MAGLGASTISNSFSSGAFTQTETRDGHAVTASYSSQGYALGTSGYGEPDASWSVPSFGSTITRTLTTGAGTAEYTWNLAGQLTQRKFPDGTAENFSYNAAGAMTSWTPAGGSALNFAPNEFGQPTTIGSLASLGYDSAGRVNTITDQAGTRTLTYANGQLQNETYTAGLLAGQAVGHVYDSQGRLQTLTLPGGISVGYTYGSNGELATVATAGGLSGTWSSYNAASGKAQSFALGALSTSAGYDALGRIASYTGTAAGVGYGLASIGYDAYGAVASVGSRSVTYDANGYLASVSGTPSFAYSFDEVARAAGHSTDCRSTERVNSGTVTVVGTVHPGATVVINSATVAVSGSVFSLATTPTANTWQSYLIRATLSGSGVGGSDAIAEETRVVFVPPPTETLTYDTAGNRTGDARWTYGWNALGQMTSAVDTRPGAATQVDFTYDVEGRLVQKQTTVAGVLTKRTTTLYDGWKPVLCIDYNGTGVETARRVYTWGADVSGSLDGAAGIGGLVEVVEKKGGSTTKSLPVGDGLGNVTGLVDASTGVSVAQYSMGPFGEMLGATGDRASACPLRFQTKAYDEDLGLYYFGKRWYDPTTRTWLSRDPLREQGGVNVYAYCGGRPFGNCDPIGGEPRSLSEADRKRLEENNNTAIAILRYYGGANAHIDTSEEIFKQKMTGSLNFGFFIPLYWRDIRIAVDNRAELEVKYPGIVDSDVVLLEAVHRNTSNAEMALASHGLLPHGQRQRLMLKVYTGMLDLTAIALTIPFQIPSMTIAEARVAAPAVSASFRGSSELAENNVIRDRVLANIAASQRARLAVIFLRPRLRTLNC